MKRLTKKTLKKIVLEVIDEARSINVEPNWEGFYRFMMHMKKGDSMAFTRVTRKMGSDWKKLAAMADKNKWKTESVTEADNGKPFPGKKDDEKKDSEDSKIAVPSDNPYDTEVNDRNEMKIPEQKLREFIRAVIGESTKFDHDKVQAMVDNDKYLNRAYKAIRGNDKTKLLRIFTTFILGDPKAERVYKKIK